MSHEKFEGERTLMRIHIGESDKWHGRPLYEAIVELLRKESFSGVTARRGRLRRLQRLSHRQNSSTFAGLAHHS
jgi:PII-like signaling protein